MKTLLLATIAIITTAMPSIATGTLPPSQPTDPVTTIAANAEGLTDTFVPKPNKPPKQTRLIGVVYCPNGQTQGPRHQICIDSIAYKPVSQPEPKTKGPKPTRLFKLAEGVDRDPRGPSTPKCSENGPNQRDCSMWTLTGSVVLTAKVVPYPAPSPGRGVSTPVIAIEEGRHVPGGRRGAPKGTQGGGTRLTA